MSGPPSLGRTDRQMAPLLRSEESIQSGSGGRRGDLNGLAGRNAAQDPALQVAQSHHRSALIVEIEMKLVATGVELIPHFLC